MKTRILIPIIAALVLACDGVYAQQDPLVSQYMFNGLYLSPAYAGLRKAPNFTAAYRKQWVNLPGAPVTQTLSYDQRIGDKMGVGLILVNDKIGVTGQTDFFGDYSYRVKLSSELDLSFGLRAGASLYRSDLNSLQVWDEGDESFTSDIVGKWIPNFGTGAMLSGEKYYAGISIPRILSYDPAAFLHVELDRSPLYERHYYLTGGYEFAFGEKYVLKPSLLFKYVQAAPAQLDINAVVYYKKMMGLGLSYRTKDAMVILLELQTKKRFKIGYSFDYSFSDLSRYASGSHEIVVSFDLEKEVAKPKLSSDDQQKPE